MNILDLVISPAFAEGSTGSAGDPLGGLPFLIIMFVLMYFLLIRPQQKRAKEHKTLLAAMKKGDEVVTNGGIIGTVTSVEDSFATLEIAQGIIVKVQKQGINQKLPKGSAKI
ncbi:Protein translocase subunit YajC [uncultured Gammaproteobacteria bacterium]|uniref:preprotein translocase subunit YajC n=1 Tax=Bathymodiolus heckerae thiotrophic gill symbiont TaxID=1052212 RepID=UPI0010B36685|nr:preprotein translocase subunit YajC [Bathymodiolus heckerae thiotrophic gill symbiont]CAC9590844.1 Protein translocase subunit YajC [uncultured Gammaproteobacteria bacterium]CAC9963697.1 Protein translocase subunit YajC [uncultured Gammaproteobacteria bacterium]CAC9965267.1 Protein translocase subunit YajC [uncultured Gammaproteobacteria bacterium]SHN91251.1 Preprotein translocase subunit YajC (TC 3.A.5.1.1) [Bathymodiolus heckerae thiotrophic gill symbiont]